MSMKNNTLALMAIAMVFGYLPWYNFSAVSSYILTEFNLTTTHMGIILSTFQVGYVIMVVFTGWLADKVGRKKVVAIATLLTGIFSILFAYMAYDFTSILVLRLLTGLSAGAIYAPGIALLTSWFPRKERGKAVGVYTAALTAAYAGGYFIAAPIAAVSNWRLGILATSIPAVLAALIIFFFVNEKPSEGLVPDTIELNKKLSVPTARTLSPRKKRLGITLAITGYMGHMWELYAFWGWIGPFLVASAFAAGYSKIDAVLIGGQLAAFIILLGAPAVWLIGIGADRWGKERMIIIAALCSLIAEFFFGFLYGHTMAIVTIIGLWIGFWSVADSGVYKVVLTDFVGEDKTATLLGVQSALGYSMTIVSPFIFGVVLERTNKGMLDSIYATNWGLPFLMLGLGAVIAPISMYFLKSLQQTEEIN